MTIATWNVNGIRARGTAFQHWVHAQRPDILCLQEIKAHSEQIPEALRELTGYRSRWHGSRTGRSGVSIHLREALGECEFTIPHFDQETRVLQARVAGIVVINIYTPLGQKSYAQKLDFLHALVYYVDALRYDHERVVLCGDFNVAHTDQDIHPALYEENMLCARTEERDILDDLSKRGLTDLFRHHHPNDARAYSWWPYYGGARARNIGWRIDYILADAPLAQASRTCRIQREEASSDHSPVVAELDLSALRGGRH